MEMSTIRKGATRRCYHMVINIKSVRDAFTARGPVVASKIKRVRQNTFCGNGWLDIAQSECAKLGYHMDTSKFGRHPDTEWPYTALVYGSYDSKGFGRSGSALNKMPCKKL